MTTAEQKHSPGRLLHVLHPGDVACGERGERFETLLGSCVAVVLTDPRRTVGAMCHIVHAVPAPAGRHDDATYADVALRQMNERLRERGLQPGQCEAYVYGGGNMFPRVYPQQSIGTRNTDWVLDALAATGVRVLQHDVGGNTYRRLRWTVGVDVPTVTAMPI
jgi:chemotaxis protein CheD